MLLAGIAACCGGAAHTSRHKRCGPGVIAACAAAVHAGFDFLWQVSAVPLTLAALVGLAIPPAGWTYQVA